MKIDRKYLAIVAGIFFTISIFYGIVRNASREKRPGMKMSLVATERGWEKRYVPESSLPSNWNEDFRVVSFVPQDVVMKVAPDFDKIDSSLGNAFSSRGFTKDGKKYYFVSINLKYLKRDQFPGSYPVALPETVDFPQDVIICTMKLDFNGERVYDDEIGESGVVYISKKDLKEILFLAEVWHKSPPLQIQ